MREIFRGWGMQSEIFCESKRILPELRAESRDVSEYQAVCRPDDIVLLHLSIGSPVNEVFRELNCRKAILYHNVTPPEYFHGLQEQIASNLRKGREQMARLAGVADVVLADSDFNAGELREMGYGEVAVLPLVLDLAKLRRGSSRKIRKQYGDGMKNILFVGRCVPNKCLEDCLGAFYFYQKYIQPGARFIHVGSHAGTEQYHALLLTFMRDLQLEHVEMPGSLPQDELNACYQSADLFLCMSEHEGFGIPLIEAMVNDIPVLAYDAAAVSETLDGAGVLFREKRFDRVAEMMDRLISEGPLRDQILKGQRERIARYEQRDLGNELRQHLNTLL